MKYIAAVDYDHLDNGVFLTSLARSLSQQQGNADLRPIIIHSDSEYTERIIQTGVMRDEATIRSIKDLNNRLVALFADEGVSAIGINPYQRNLITLQNGTLKLDHSFFDTLPSQSTLLLSTLIQNDDKDQIESLSLPRLVTFLQKELETDELFLFSKSDESEIFTDKKTETDISWDTMDSEFRKQQIPDEFNNFNHPVKIATARDFNQLPNLEQTIAINSS
ncbi:hypothetical protein CK503_01675 [Aliifodinibius salipaludis]|uniref:Uncharacterized protein n=1 Tax=Fodinibius salipaludis TaxID=2032627 RepID=A0A2A2GG10_9BACT|nr:hypothetical protein [Aliifodinibius salipaludis]PAU95795.1 hypothetical protein CK503_01675 [Aliifodinibius salipaludis]